MFAGASTQFTTSPPSDVEITRIESNRSPMLDLVNDASSRLTGQLPGNAPLVVALRAVRSATQRGSTEHLTAALDDADLAISLSRDIDALPSADRDAVALHLMILRQLAAAEPGR